MGRLRFTLEGIEFFGAKENFTEIGLGEIRGSLWHNFVLFIKHPQAKITHYLTKDIITPDNFLEIANKHLESDLYVVNAEYSPKRIPTLRGTFYRRG